MRELADYIHAAKYARVNDNGTLETRTESVERYFRFLDSEGAIPDELRWQYDRAKQAMIDGKIQPSMRLLQRAGHAVTSNNARAYNCWGTLCDRVRFFAEDFWLLLSGGGTGANIRRRYVNRLPAFALRIGSTERHRIEDSIEGWAEALNRLIVSYLWDGTDVEFDYSRVRPRGMPISSGGVSPGPEPLERALENIRALFDALIADGQPRLRPVDCNDIRCFASQAVQSGGIRRSAMLATFDPDDTEMLYSKHPDNFQFAWGDNPGKNAQRAMCNISAAIIRGEEEHLIPGIVDVCRDSNDKHGPAEPGIHLQNNPWEATNPCAEATFEPIYDHEAYDGWRDTTAAYRWKKGGDPRKPVEEQYGGASGWSACNLTEVNVAACTTPAEFYEACHHAALIGTSQATLTNLKYLGPVSEAITRRDALLGVGLTGVLDNPSIGLNSTVLKRGALTVRETNRRAADLLRINPAARLTVVKPSGTSSKHLGIGSSGIHPSHAPYYLLTVRASKHEPAAQILQATNPHLFEEDGDQWLLTFPMWTPEDAITRDDVSAADFLDNLYNVYDAWIKPGRNRGSFDHNISNTITIRDNEWSTVASSLTENSHRIGATSFMAYFNDQAPIRGMPRVRVNMDDLDHPNTKKWHALLDQWQPVSYATTAVGGEEVYDPSTTTNGCDSERCNL